MEKVDDFINKTLSLLRRIKIYPFLLQILIFSIFCFLMISLIKRNALSTLNPGMMIIWHIWWPLIPLLILFTGRLWCSICPFSSTANVINKILPYHFLDPKTLNKSGLTIALIVFITITALDSIFPMIFNQSYTLIFFLTLFSMMIVLAILYDDQTYCNVICLFGVFSRVYERFSLLKIQNTNNICTKCNRSVWIKSSRFGKSIIEDKNRAFENRNWKLQVECLKKCPTNSMRITYVNPLKDKSAFDGLMLAEVLAPSIIIVLFTVYIFIKSYYFIYLYNTLQLFFTLSLNSFIIIAVAFVTVSISLINLAIIYVARYDLKTDKDIILKSFTSIAPLLLFFHISLVLKEMHGITSIGHLSETWSFLEQYFPSKTSMQNIAYFLTLCGIILSMASFFYVTGPSDKSSSNISSAFLFLFGTVFAFHSLLAIMAIRYSQYFD